MKFIFFYKLKFKYYLKPYIWSLKKELQRDSIIEIQLSDKQRDILNRLKVSCQEKKYLMSGIHYCQKLKNTIKI